MKPTLSHLSILPAILLAVLVFPLPVQSASQGQDSSYTVRRGDSLWKIAKKQLNDPYLWPVLYDLNKNAIDNPDLIEPGWKLTVPTSLSPQQRKEARALASQYAGPKTRVTRKASSSPAPAPEAPRTQKPKQAAAAAPVPPQAQDPSASAEPATGDEASETPSSGSWKTILVVGAILGILAFFLKKLLNPGAPSEVGEAQEPRTLRDMERESQAPPMGSPSPLEEAKPLEERPKEVATETPSPTEPAMPETQEPKRVEEMEREVASAPSPAPEPQAAPEEASPAPLAESPVETPPPQSELPLEGPPPAAQSPSQPETPPDEPHHRDVA